MRKIHVYVKEIIVKDGRRPVDQDKVKELAESIKQIGLLHPITVKCDEKDKTLTYTLVAGAHRLEAFKLLGKESIDAKVVMKGDLQTELIEIDENLIRNEMGYLLRSDTLARKKEIYEKLYPETKREATLKQNLPKDGIRLSERPSFVTDTAQKTGRSETTIKEELQIANNIIPEAKPVLQEQNISKTEAIKLAREEPEVQKKIIPIFESGQTKKVEEAKKIIDPIDEQYKKDAAEIDAKHKRVDKVMKLLNYTQYLGITEQSILDYFDIFPKNRDSFIKDLERLKTLIDETIEIFNNLNQIRRVK